MVVEIRSDTLELLHEYARIPIAFEVREILDVLDGQTFSLTARRLETSYVKDYDLLPGAKPEEWAARCDMTRWGLFGAWLDGERVGGAAVAVEAEGLGVDHGRRDVAVLWDLRVAPDRRRSGVGSQLFQASIAWAAARNCKLLEVETQNTNVPACRFYVRHGCTLVDVQRSAYPDLPAEIKLIWRKEIL